MQKLNNNYELKKKEEISRQKRFDEMIRQGCPQTAVWQFQHRAYASGCGNEQYKKDRNIHLESGAEHGGM